MFNFELVGCSGICCLDSDCGVFYLVVFAPLFKQGQVPSVSVYVEDVEAGEECNTKTA